MTPLKFSLTEDYFDRFGCIFDVNFYKKILNAYIKIIFDSDAFPISIFSNSFAEAINRF